MTRELIFDPSDLEGTLVLLRGAAARAPAIALPPWHVVPEPELALGFAAPPDRGAWIQLGVTAEAIGVAGAAAGLAVAVDLAGEEPPLKITRTACTISAPASRLAACLRAPRARLADEPQALASHVSARLALAAGAYDCALAWFESSRALDQLAAALPPGTLPPAITAVALIAAPRDGRDGLVRGGRAACRVWLEAVSLGLAVMPLGPAELAAAAALDAESEGGGPVVAGLALGAKA